jgi:RNA polymerase subunit RPABC4/transcription elongation factor Spt4
LHEPLGITLVVVFMGMTVIAFSVKVMYNKFYHVNQLPLGPFKIGGRNSDSAEESADQFAANGLSDPKGSIELTAKMAKTNVQCTNCDNLMPKGTQFCHQCGTKYTFKAGVATRGFTAKDKPGNTPSYFEVVSGFCRRYNEQGGPVKAEIALPLKDSKNPGNGPGLVNVSRVDDPNGAQGRGLTVHIERNGNEMSILCESEQQAAEWFDAVLGAVQQAGGETNASRQQQQRLQEDPQQGLISGGAGSQAASAGGRDGRGGGGGGVLGGLNSMGTTMRKSVTGVVGGATGAVTSVFK